MNDQPRNASVEAAREIWEMLVHAIPDYPSDEDEIREVAAIIAAHTEAALEQQLESTLVAGCIEVVATLVRKGYGTSLADVVQGVEDAVKEKEAEARKVISIGIDEIQTLAAKNADLKARLASSEQAIVERDRMSDEAIAYWKARLGAAEDLLATLTSAPGNG